MDRLVEKQLEEPVGVIAQKIVDNAINAAKDYQAIKKANVINSKPKQYLHGIDTFMRAESNMSFEERMGFIKGNIDKYNWRKKGQDKEDFIKIMAYCEYALKQIENEN